MTFQCVSEMKKINYKISVFLNKVIVFFITNTIEYLLLTKTIIKPMKKRNIIPAFLGKNFNRE